MVAPRAARLPFASGQAILLHEMGHAIDFHCFGERYRTGNLNKIGSVKDAAVRANLLQVDAKFFDAEFRADALGSLLALRAPSLQPVSMRIAYDVETLVQKLVPIDTPCYEVDESRRPDELPGILERARTQGVTVLSHYPHRPVAGIGPSRPK